MFLDVESGRPRPVNSRIKPFMRSLRRIRDWTLGCEHWTFLQMKKDDIDVSAVEDHGGILTILGGGARRDWNGIHYKQGMSGKNVGTTSLSANIATIPPGGVAYAHIHVGFEVILYIIEGRRSEERRVGKSGGLSGGR